MPDILPLGTALHAIYQSITIRGVPIWVFLHVPMSDIDSTKNTNNQYSLPIFLLVFSNM